jgi:hypothetical protein
MAYWLFQTYQTGAGLHDYITMFSEVFTKVAKVLEILGYMNEQGPFFFDMIFAPAEVNYSITQQNGSLTETIINGPPVADFSVYPPAGIIGTMFQFDASISTDDNDGLSMLSFRWDWEGDSNWDTSWSNSPQASHSFSESGAYNVTLEVKDSMGLIHQRSHTINVGGGAGTATHVKLFQDNLPWDSNAMENMLLGLGFQYGTGPDTYEIISSDQMETIPLIPGEDLVIIANDQKQSFYENYADAQVRFTNFVYIGGSILWEACDEGWADGSLSRAGVILPGNVGINPTDFDYQNFIANPDLPLLAGLPTVMDHNYASHESFYNLPDGTTIYCTNENYQPTLVEFNLGGGWIIITGQPLEHQFDRIYDNPDMEELLPRIVSYFTGKTLAKPVMKKKMVSTRSSRGESSKR